MTIVLPKLFKNKCQDFTACGRVLEVSKAQKKLFSKNLDLIAETGQGAHRQFIRLAMNDSNHLHLDVARPSYFGELVPEKNSTWPEIEEILSKFEGQKLRFNADVTFVVSPDAISKSGISSLLFLETKSATVSMKLTSGTLSVSGGPIRTITWRILPQSSEVKIGLMTVQDCVLNELYLVKLFDSLIESYRALIVPDEKVS